MTNRNFLKVLPFLLIGFGLVLIGGIILLTLLRTPSLSEQASDLSNSSTLPHPEISRISIEDAKTAYDRRSAVFVDVRGKEYYMEGHIPTALSIPENEISEHLNDLESSDWIITYCT